ncbi:MAG: hypothetical protein AAF914_03960, partial [Pseudomonadota bacterium]
MSIVVPYRVKSGVIHRLTMIRDLEQLPAQPGVYGIFASPEVRGGQPIPLHWAEAHKDFLTEVHEDPGVHKASARGGAYMGILIVPAELARRRILNELRAAYP